MNSLIAHYQISNFSFSFSEEEKTLSGYKEGLLLFYFERYSSVLVINHKLVFSGVSIKSHNHAFLSSGYRRSGFNLTEEAYKE